MHTTLKHDRYGSSNVTDERAINEIEGLNRNGDYSSTLNTNKMRSNEFINVREIPKDLSDTTIKQDNSYIQRYQHPMNSPSSGNIYQPPTKYTSSGQIPVNLNMQETRTNPELSRPSLTPSSNIPETNSNADIKKEYKENKTLYHRNIDLGNRYDKYNPVDSKHIPFKMENYNFDRNIEREMRDINMKKETNQQSVEGEKSNSIERNPILDGEPQKEFDGNKYGYRGNTQYASNSGALTYYKSRTMTGMESNNNIDQQNKNIPPSDYSSKLNSNVLNKYQNESASAIGSLASEISPQINIAKDSPTNTKPYSYTSRTHGSLPSDNQINPINQRNEKSSYNPQNKYSFEPLQNKDMRQGLDIRDYSVNTGTDIGNPLSPGALAREGLYSKYNKNFEDLDNQEYSSKNNTKHKTDQRQYRSDNKSEDMNLQKYTPSQTPESIHSDKIVSNLGVRQPLYTQTGGDLGKDYDIKSKLNNIRSQMNIENRRNFQIRTEESDNKQQAKKS